VVALVWCCRCMSTGSCFRMPSGAFVQRRSAPVASSASLGCANSPVTFDERPRISWKLVDTRHRVRHWRARLHWVSGRDRKSLSRQRALRQLVETRLQGRKLANQRRAVQKTPHPGTWRHFVASRAAHDDAHAIRLSPRAQWAKSAARAPA